MIVEPADFARRIIEPDQFVADTEAFVDVRIERSRGKASYSFIGPGVSQNADQSINLTVPHGFNVGAASMPHGVVNNQHMHYTAEVFICTRGSFRMNIGRDAEQTLDLGPGDVFAAPPWVFRGFENTGPDDSWVFVVLGGDETGGVMWSPDVLREAAETGLYLSSDLALVEAAEAPANAIVPASDDDLAQIDSYTDQALEGLAARRDGRSWSNRAMLSAVLEGHRSSLAPALGFGMSEDRSHRAPIVTAQGFSIEWLKVAPGSTTGTHRIAENQVLLLAEGDWNIAVNEQGERLDAKPATGSVVSIPAGAWREFANVGSDDAIAAVVCGTDSPNHIEWDRTIIDAARAQGWARDASAKIAPVALLQSDAGHRENLHQTDPHPGGNP